MGISLVTGTWVHISSDTSWGREGSGKGLCENWFKCVRTQVQHLLRQGEVLVPATRGVSEDGGWKAEHASTGQQRLDHPLGEALLGALSVVWDEYTGIYISPIAGGYRKDLWRWWARTFFKHSDLYIFFVQVTIRFYRANNKRALQTPKFALQHRTVMWKACYFAVSKNQCRPSKEQVSSLAVVRWWSKASQAF